MSYYFVWGQSVAETSGHAGATLGHEFHQLMSHSHLITAGRYARTVHVQYSDV